MIQNASQDVDFTLQAIQTTEVSIGSQRKHCIYSNYNEGCASLYMSAVPRYAKVKVAKNQTLM